MTVTGSPKDFLKGIDEKHALYIGQQRRLSPARFPARAASIVCAMLVTTVMAGCSTAIPLPSFSNISKDDVTGSIRPQSPLSSSLDGEDWRRAKGALSVALDPQGNGAPVTWENPQSKIKGSFVPVGQAWVKDDNVCRTFLAELGGSHPAQQLQGNACRDKSGEWSVGKVEPWKKV